MQRTPFHDKYVCLELPLPASHPHYTKSNTCAEYFYSARLVLPLIELGGVAYAYVSLVPCDACLNYFSLNAAAWTTDLQLMTIFNANIIRITYTWPPVLALTTCDPKRHGNPYYNSLRNLRARTWGRSELGCFAVIDGQTLSWKTKPDPVPRATNG